MTRRAVLVAAVASQAAAFTAPPALMGMQRAGVCAPALCGAPAKPPRAVALRMSEEQREVVNIDPADGERLLCAEILCCSSGARLGV